ncbi:MAG: APC family permease [Ruminococcaceae bacterium]|nr:APC family permease [Oscillospiraceae bacterium]
MSSELKKKYGLMTAICLVVGTVIGSGVFFKAQDVLKLTGGNMVTGILAWAITGLVMLACILAFAIISTKYEKVNGVVDYAEALVGPRYGYFIGWFMSVIYYPAMTSTLARVSARYFVVFMKNVNPNFGFYSVVNPDGADFSALAGPETMTWALVFLVGVFAMNALAPKIAGYFQVSATFIKMVPIAMVMIGGVIYGLVAGDGMLVENFTAVSDAVKSDVTGNPLFAAIIATAFAYEGWIVATSINAELNNAKRNLPIALICGGVIIVLVYILYFVGVAGGASTETLRAQGATVAFTNIYGKTLGLCLDAFVVISCLGTLNGLMLAGTRSIYAMSSRGRGPQAETFSQVDKKTNMPANSAIFFVFVTAVWLMYFYFANMSYNASSWVGVFAFDSSELPIVTMYPLYIPIFIMFMKRSKGEGFIKRFVIPFFAICASIFMGAATIYSHGIQRYMDDKTCPVFYYLIVFAVIMVIGMFFVRAKNVMHPNQKKKKH